MGWVNCQQQDIGSFICSLEQAEASLPTCSSATDLSAQSKLTPIAKKSCKPDKKTEHFHGSLSGTTSKPLTARRGVGGWIALLGDSPVSTFQRLNQGTKTRGCLPASIRAYGESLPVLLTRLSLRWSSLKTPLHWSVGDLTLSSATLPDWGMMQDGECWALGTLAEPISAKGSLYWPTPVASKHVSTGNILAYLKLVKHRKISLQEVEAMIGCYLNRPSLRQKHALKRSKDLLKQSKKRPKGVGMAPDWRECLMDWPIGWTDIWQSAMASFQQ